MEKVTNQLNVEIPRGGFVDEGNGVVSFPNGLTITDGSVQRNGTRYDMETLDVSKYGNQLTGDHKDELGKLIGETIGVVKKDGKVVVNKIRYAVKQNPYARLAYDLLVGGFSKNFSTETIGPLPDPNSGVYYNAELVGLSQVVTQNNYSAHINQVVHNSLERSKQDGLDVTGIEELVLNHVEKENMEETKKVETETKVEETKVVPAETETNTNTESTTAAEEVASEGAKVDNDAAEEVETQEVETVDNGKSIETKTTTTVTEYEYVESEQEIAERKAREAKWEEERKQELAAEAEPDVVVVVTDTIANETDKKETNKKEEKMDEENKVENSVLTAAQVAEIVTNALKPISDELATVKADAKNAFDASAKEPEFKKEEVATNDYASMDWKDRYQEQIDAAWNYVKTGSIVAGEKLRSINAVNLEGLKEAGIARNSITLDDLGNFIIPKEMYNEIQGHRNDYSAILSATEWRETLSLEFAWLKRVGDINMQNVAIGVDLGAGVDGNDDARLKPVSEYSAVPQKSQLEELAAVTVVATSATRFAAVDLLADAAAGYRNDYDRKRAQLVIAKLEEAIDETGFSVAYNPSSDVDALATWIEAITAISDTTLNGTLIFNARTFAELKSRALKAGANGPLSEILTTGDLPTVFGYRFIVVPNDLMPSLGGSESVAHYVDGVAKTINHAVYFADLTAFTGRTSGGLQYDVSNSAPYEVGGQVKSAYQRNELVLRGSFFRGGAVKDVNVVAGVRQGNDANVS